MKLFRSQILAIGVAVLTISVAQADEKLKADRSAVDSACSQEAATAGCTGKVVGKGLLKCMHAYRKEHKDFKPGPACESALKQLRSDHKAKKEEREEKKAEKVEKK